MNAIEMKNLTKIYGHNYALRDFTLNIETGRVYGLIGPNGAGKTTAMSVLATLLAPDGGSATVGGHDVVREPAAVRRMIGYMPDFFGVYDGLKANEYLDFYAAAYRIPVSRRPRLIQDLLELVNLSDKTDTYVDFLSRGMKQRLALARCLVHDPAVLILDEPASGLDPRARAEMKEVIRQLRRMSKTILISSHILPELAEMCDNIAIMEQGRLVAHGTVEEVTAARQGSRVFKIEVADKLEELLDYLHKRPDIVSVDSENGWAKVALAGNKAAQGRLLRDIMNEGWQVLEFAEMKGNLEDAFMAVTGEVSY
ncbi:ABC transporter ATP-binding protein [Desulforamulus hydrothermalis]|uniref:ABC transporter related protein n=1 Tax=Desulforamulus hydrothermalis Lam5 = DSM 18033 TaxID=1121428 RepID=K8DXS4_9FIRM|nr:ABC transporter ATP-binding protein [Desulforamulus hydrothermalis]CCO07434.1 ABC transporter related protein [Desulforamulus hydrothermalis Lam5 = DSM 18033]SHH18539.1 ABC-2 type transport system ATP-binding protein [Desulforamulus hydrothermalis Lam5 = DSM 18033]